MRLTLFNRLKICWETLTIKSGHPHTAHEKQLPTFLHGYDAGRRDGRYESHFDTCVPQKDLYKPCCFGDVYKSFHDCEPCPVFDSCEMEAMVEEL